MIQRSFGAAFAAFLLLYAAASARADIIQTRDGKWWSGAKGEITDQMKDAKGPSDKLLKESGKHNLSLSYTTVRIGPRSFSAGLVASVWPTECYVENDSFKNADLQAQTGAFREGAANFAAAAEGLRGSDKEVTMWKRVLCLAATNDAPKTLDAAQQLLDAFPKTWYFAQAQDKRARIFLNMRKSEDAKAALQSVVDAPAMNARDYFEAKLASAHFFLLAPAGRDPKKLAAAQRAYMDIINEIKGRSADDASEAKVELLKATVAVGRCYVYLGDFDKARPYLEQVVNDKDSLADKGLLAQAYTGLGDVVYGTVKAELEKKPSKDKLPGINNQLTQAALDYLRVAKFYVESAGDDLYPATVGLARVWATQFTVNESKDCAMANRAVQYFITAHRMLHSGEQKRLLTREVKKFMKLRDDAGCNPRSQNDKKGK
jgi:tetratricopeptide (TPR) repeat protein